MKNFIFSLEALAKYKTSLEKKQKAELARVMAHLKTLYQERANILAALDANIASLQRALEKQSDLAQELKRHDDYRIHLRQLLEEVKQRIVTAQAEEKRLRALLIITMKELKTLERLRFEQYQAYLAEVRKEESLIIGDIIAHSNSI
ncbi:MAG: hypothetical protein FWG61_08295 [Firmicutes bacterium]|nr:hypothetical protein [Bacillota bacterium]